MRTKETLDNRCEENIKGMGTVTHFSVQDVANGVTQLEA